MIGNTTGSYNVGLGYEALKSNTTGDNNIGIGRAGDVITTGSDNITIGQDADPSSATASNQIVIGSGATGHGDNIVVIGNGNATAIHPHDDNEVDLGSSSYSFKDAHIEGLSLIHI